LVDNFSNGLSGASERDDGTSLSIVVVVVVVVVVTEAFLRSAPAQKNAFSKD
jgi:hypothetical protein